ncbi:MAG: hypothetical protein ACJ74T_05975 [Pyrinomonadaceae bacterium]
MAENENAVAPATEDTSGAGEEAAAPESQAVPAAEPAAEAAADAAEAAPPEEITYHAVEKDGEVSAIWEMQGRKHLRTIDPRSRQGQEILRLYTAEHGE